MPRKQYPLILLCSAILFLAMTPLESSAQVATPRPAATSATQPTSFTQPFVGGVPSPTSGLLNGLQSIPTSAPFAAPTVAMPTPITLPSLNSSTGQAPPVPTMIPPPPTPNIPSVSMPTSAPNSLPQVGNNQLPGVSPTSGSQSAPGAAPPSAPSPIAQPTSISSLPGSSPPGTLNPGGQSAPAAQPTQAIQAPSLSQPGGAPGGAAPSPGTTGSGSGGSATGPVSSGGGTSAQVGSAGGSTLAQVRTVPSGGGPDPTAVASVLALLSASGFAVRGARLWRAARRQNDDQSEE